MTAIESTIDPELGTAAQSNEPWQIGAEVSWWGMLLLCVTESALFAYLLAGYLYLGVSNAVWPPVTIGNPALQLPLLMTVVLLSSSAMLVWAERALVAGRRSAYRWRTVLTTLLGATFLILQVFEYQEQLKKGGPTQHAYSSMFFTITGFHGAHVLFGMLMLLWTVWQEFRGHVNIARPTIVKNTSLYWHFVDGVWLVLLTVLYLTPRLYSA
jgi:heme/copper-type cytochrome/quinol oxidase subunit 3